MKDSRSFVEKILQAQLDNDASKTKALILQEIRQAKESGHYNVAKKYESLLLDFSKHSSLSGQSLRKEIVLDRPLTNLYERIEPEVSVSEIVLSKFNKDVISEWLNEWRHKDLLSSHDLFPSNKFLLYGPPGTGKTLLANAIAHELALPLILVRLDEIISSYLGKTGKNIRTIFDIAKEEDSVIFLDEIDALAKSRDDSTELGELKRVVTVLLQNIDNFSQRSILIGATNHEELLDNALWRRFDIRIKMENPQKKERLQLFKYYIAPEIYKNLPLSVLVSYSRGLSGASIKKISKNIQKKITLAKDNPVNYEVLAIKELLIALQMENKISKADKYKLIKELISSGLDLTKVSDATGVPYTTIRDNI